MLVFFCAADTLVVAVRAYTADIDADILDGSAVELFVSTDALVVDP